MTSPKVSIIIPVYNTEKYLRECLDSVIHQTLTDIDIICVNDGSTDGSGAILQEYARKDPRFNVIHTPNQKSLLARKTGIFQAHGKYTYFMDADDYLTNTDSLKLMVATIETCDKDIVQFSIDINSKENPDKKQEFSQWHKVINQEIIGAKNILESCFINNKHSWVLWNKIFKTTICQKAFQHIKDLSIRTAEDAYIYFLIVYFSKSFIGKQTPPIYTYRLGSGISSKESININEFKEFCSEIMITTHLKNFLTEFNTLSEYKYLLDTLNERIFQNALDRFKQLNKCNFNKGFYYLFKYFNSNFIKECIINNKKFNLFKLLRYKIINIILLNNNKKYLIKYFYQKLYSSIINHRKVPQ